jgi:nucleotide-binding universal stress UspA family protein
MHDSILVPTDGSEGARVATRHAMNLAAAFDSEIHLLSVVNASIYNSDLADLDFEAGEHREALEEHATEAVGTLEALLDERGLTYRTAIEEGVPHEAIPDYAANHDIDLLSMGTHGRTGFDRLLVGSVTERVVRTSDVPVLTSRSAPDEQSSYDDILLPTDGSEAASAAIEHAIALAGRYDATIHALSVVDLSALAGSYDGGAAVPGVIESLEGGSEQAVSEVAERCERHGVDVRTEVTQGTPYQAIGAYVEEGGIDLVTMGTHGRTGLGRYLLGSVTERVVQTSKVPVLTVR